MNVGERIFSDKTKQTYTVLQTLKAGGQSEVCFAKTDKSEKIFFLKRFLSIKYSDKSKHKLKCQKFEEERRKIYSLINSNTLPGGTCSYVFDFFRENTFYYVVTEKIEGFELCPLKLSECIPIEDRLFLFRIIVFSFMPFERNGIVHADIKPENIFIEKYNNHLIARNLDFESSFFIDTPPPPGCIVGTEPYYSPELAEYNSEKANASSTYLSTKSDIFSLGLILYELLTGGYPKTNDYEYWYEASREGMSLPMPKDWSKRLKMLVSSMLDPLPTKRPSIMGVLNCLKQVEDMTTEKIPFASPIVKIEHESPEKAIVQLLNLFDNATMFYSFENSDFLEYVGPFYIYQDDIRIKFKLIDKSNHEETVFDDVISVSTKKYKRCRRPKITIIGGAVFISSDDLSSKIYYTIDGTSPIDNGIFYQTPFPVKRDVRIKAVAKRVGYLTSEISMVNSSSKIKIR